VPPVFKDMLILRGPLFARVVPDGLLIRADPKDQPNDTRLDDLIGPDTSFEPLLVNESGQSEDLLAYWNACVLGKLQIDDPLEIRRTFSTRDGELVHEADPIPLKLEERGGKVLCHDMLEKVPGGTIPPGKYRYDVTVTYANGDAVSHGSARLHVKE